MLTRFRRLTLALTLILVMVPAALAPRAVFVYWTPRAVVPLTRVLFAQEAVTLTAPVVKTATTCALDSVFIDIKNLRILATLEMNTGDTLTKQYDSTTTPTGASLLTSLNRGNFSVNSLIKAVHNRLILDGVCVGTITGSPQ